MLNLIPSNEQERLATLELYRILDTEAEKIFDDLTRLAAKICETPISTVSIIDRNRQWSKAAYGVERGEAPRDIAFCSHTILVDDLLVVDDLAADSRFAENPMVQGEPSLRFYAGAPLEVRKGQRIGTLCVIDSVPRQLTQAQRESLTILRDAVVGHLEVRRAYLDLQALQHVLPMCAWCRDVRVSDGSTEDGDEELWQPLHQYVMDQAKVTHGICPRCRDACVADV